MEFMKTKAWLTVTCRHLKNPRLQRSRFDQTLAANSWMLQENKAATVHENGSVTTLTVWGRLFSGKKTEREIEKLTGNLLKRAAQYAGIEDYTLDLKYQKAALDHDEFELAPVLFSED